MIWIWLLVGFGIVALLLVGPMRRRRAVKEQDSATVLLREEQLQLSKTREPLAAVTTHMEVSSELKTVTVPVRREELVVEKDGEEVARIPVREERVDVSTRTVPLNEVSVYRREWEEEREVQAVLKKEVARIEANGTATYTETEPRG